MFSGSSPKSRVIKIITGNKQHQSAGVLCTQAQFCKTTTEWMILNSFFQIVLPVCAGLSIFLLQFLFHKGMHNKFHKMLHKMFLYVVSPLRICISNTLLPKLGWPQICKWTFKMHLYTYVYSINVNCNRKQDHVWSKFVWCCSAAASKKQNSSAGCHNGSTLLGIRTDKVTHERINDYKMPTSPPCWNQPSWCECSVPKHCPGKANWDS